MSRSSDAYADHMQKGGHDLSGVQPEKCQAERLARAAALLTEAGYTVIPPVVTTTAN